MSNIHASLDVFDRMAPASRRTPTDAIPSLRVFGNGLATRLFSGFQHRWTMQRIARFSDHRLKDMGFERDWDGSIIHRQR
ncbi:hypothetical protein ACDY96_00565 [Rhizobium mongolense]|uniref:hypothetical protein n=1 Tax=Rhizobium TaxID=379 RepID=UPI0024B20D4B|nr:hypothetical protein [Rhizobium sp. CC1099]WFU86398.1 hypothetical protein QA644_14850 [Rhizobium sp. CC1099]